MLTIATPNLDYEQLAAGVAAMEKPLSVGLGPVLADGNALGSADLKVAGLLAFRRAAPGATTEVWNRDAKRWEPDPTPDLSAVSTEMLAFRADQPTPWQGIVVPAGGMDATGRPQFGKVVGGYPSYTFRARFVTRTGESGVSAPSQAVAFASVADANLMILGPGDDEKPDQATLARIELKSPGLQTIGGLVIRRDAPGAQITLSNAAGAAVVLQPDGSIEMRPAPGKGVLIAGDIETERVVYQPAGGGLKKTLA
jgi:hypothetical protein